MMWTRLILGVAVPALTVAACGGGDSSGGEPNPATMVPVTSSASTVATTAAPVVDPTTSASATTVGPATTVRSTTTVASTVAPPTTGQPTGPCDIALIIEQTQSSVPGVTPTSLRCADDWASWSGAPDDPMTMDGYFAVAQWVGGAWELRNLGTSGICGDGGVPAALWSALDCVE